MLKELVSKVGLIAPSSYITPSSGTTSDNNDDARYVLCGIGVSGLNMGDGIA